MSDGKRNLISIFRKKSNLGASYPTSAITTSIDSDEPPRVVVIAPTSNFVSQALHDKSAFRMPLNAATVHRPSVDSDASPGAVVIAPTSNIVSRDFDNKSASHKPLNAASVHQPSIDPSPTGHQPESMVRSTDILRQTVDTSNLQEEIKYSRALSLQRNASDSIQNRHKQRFRGFSTSISALFLDEQVVCGSLAFCGILASIRTEHLLQKRNIRRGVTDQRESPSSAIIWMSFIATMVVVIVTYLIWGSGSNSNTFSFHSSRSLERDSTSYPQSTTQVHIQGFLLTRHYKEFLWDPLLTYFSMCQPLLWCVPKGSASDQDSSRSLTDTYYFTNDDTLNGGVNISMYIRVATILFFLLILAVVGREKRLRVRYALLKARIQEDRIYDDGERGSYTRSSSRVRIRDERETASEGSCSHTFCGCYPIDKHNLSSSVIEEEEDNNNSDVSQRCFSFISLLCCGHCFKTWIQCFSLCALAQEAREVRLLVPPKMQRVDLLTNQPFDDYYKDIYLLRRGWKGLHDGVPISNWGWRPHFRALSSLSSRLFLTFLIALTTVIITMILNPRFFFTIGDAFVIIITFVQSFTVLGIVHGIFHKSDLSLDAVIKFFAAGFLIATASAYLLEGIVLNLIIGIYYIIYIIFNIISRGGFGIYLEQKHYGMLMIMSIIEAYIVAALSEEFCKYYTFRTIEHPDLIFLTGLDRSKRISGAVMGGDEAYPFSSINASAAVSRTGSFEADYNGSKSTKKYRGVSPVFRELNAIRRSQFDENDEGDQQPEVRTASQRAAAVTTALISTAVGLACAENFIYVFFLGRGSSTREELVLLLFRSLFPVHALCGALQSIGLIRKFLEADEDSKRIGVGQIVLPAIILHGTFDSIILVINILIEKSWDTYNSGMDLNATLPRRLRTMNALGGVGLVSVMFMGVAWYYVKNKDQQKRLKKSTTEPIDGGYRSPII